MWRDPESENPPQITRINEVTAEVIQWIDSYLARAGMSRIGEPAEPRIRPWATVVRIPTTCGAAWFKSASPATAHEMRIYELLARTRPSTVLHPIALDPERAWMLLPDGGTSLLHSVTGDELLEAWVKILPEYAQLQRALMSETDSLLHAGVPDMRPTIMPQRFEEATGISRKIVDQQGNAGDRAMLSRIESFRSRYRECCEELHASPVASSLDHSDLHANNVLLSAAAGSLGTTARVYDWGDSVVGAPFASLLVTLRSLQDELHAGTDDPRLARVRDAYLEIFSDLASHAELVRIVELACKISRVTRSLTWAQALALDPHGHPEWSMAPFAWMKSIPEDDVLA